MAHTASYTTPNGRARLVQVAAQLMDELSHCRVCAHACGVDRTHPQTGLSGACRTGQEVLVSSAYPHFGEENVLRGQRGSGAVFFSRCNMGCAYCQNETISGKNAPGRVLSATGLADLFLDLQARGVHNLNWVTPSHVAPQAVAALKEAAGRGLRLPVVYNTGCYDHFTTIRALDGLVDIYLPDLKTLDEKHARTLLKAPGYPDAALMCLEEMIRQVGMAWVYGAQGTLARGLLVRHLVLPGEGENTLRVLEGLKEAFGVDLPLHLMGQYIPNHRVRQKGESADLAQPLDPKTYLGVLRAAKQMGFKQLVGIKSAA